MVRLNQDAPQDLAGSIGGKSEALQDKLKVSSIGKFVKSKLLEMIPDSINLRLLCALLTWLREKQLDGEYSREASGVVDCTNALIESCRKMVLHG